MNIKEFVIDLKRRGVEYDKSTGYHWDGIKVISNLDMDIMCSNRFGRDYELLTDPEKRKIREEVFRQLRGDSDG